MAQISFYLQEFLFMYPGTLEDTSPLYHMNHFLQPAELVSQRNKAYYKGILKTIILNSFQKGWLFFVFFCNHLYTVLHNSSGVQYMQQNIPVEYKILLKSSSLEFFEV